MRGRKENGGEEESKKGGEDSRGDKIEERIEEKSKGGWTNEYWRLRNEANKLF